MRGEWNGKLGTPSCGPLPLSTSPLHPQKGGCLPNPVSGCHQGCSGLRCEGEALFLRLSLCAICPRERCACRL